MERNVTGLMVVKDQAPTVGLAIESTVPFFSEYHIVVNDATDDTLGEVRRAASRLSLDATVRTQSGRAGEIMYDMMQSAEGLAFRFEGDQIFYWDRLGWALEKADDAKTLNLTSKILQNRFDLQHSSHPTNAPHPHLYNCDDEIVHPESRQWPRSRHNRSRSIQHPVAINARVHRPHFRLRRWHRPSWRRDPGEDMPEYMVLSEYDRPYELAMTLDAYMEALWDREKGAFHRWGGETLEEAARRYVEWDIEENCEPYDGEYPGVLEEYIDEHGYGIPV